MKDKLELRKRLNAKRPAFKKTDSYKHKKLTDSWRAPKGLQNKVRLERWGKPAIVKAGYRNPAAVRGLHPFGLEIVRVESLRDLDKVDAKTQGALLARVGMRKARMLLEECSKRKITVLNVKSIEDALKEIDASLAKRKEAKSARAKKKAVKKPSKEKVKEEKPKPEPKSREQERKEMEKVLIKRN